MSEILTKLINKQNLTEHDTDNFLTEVIKGQISNTEAGAILTALRMKGETVEEITGLVKAMRKHMKTVTLKNAIDVCGTGGDGSGTFNISTAVSFVVGGTGVRVAKHGNRAASSTCGSADVLEALGVHINLTSQQAENVYENAGMVFLFAQSFHPAMRNVVGIRKELSIRTVFNFLGPFINPASVDRQLIGVPDAEIAAKLAAVGKKLGYKQLLIVTSVDGMDEISTISKTTLREVKHHVIKKTVVNPAKLGFKKASKKALLGGLPKENARIITDILAGVRDAKRDIVVLNSAYALYVAGHTKNIQEGIRLAEESIDSGRAKKVLESLKKETQKYA